jgi:hypothetical protein
MSLTDLNLIWVNATDNVLSAMTFLSAIAAGLQAPSSSEAVVLFKEMLDGPNFRSFLAPVDLCCIAPNCGAVRVKKGQVMATVEAQTDDPDDVGFVWNTASTFVPGGTFRSALFNMAAVCPNKRCWMSAFDRLSKFVEKSLNRRAQKAYDHCSHCCRALEPSSSIPCHDKCGCEWYCSREHEAAARPTHDRAAEVRRSIDAKRRTCAACGTQGIKLKCCGRCHNRYYCNVTCQRTHWPAHKTDCDHSVLSNVSNF